MATVSDSVSDTIAHSAPRSRDFIGDQRFFTRLAIGLALFIVIAFAQFALRGIVDYRTAPFWVHLHGGLMLAWLALFTTQNWLIERRAIVQHRVLGRIGVVLAMLVALTASFTGYWAVAMERQPSFFPPAYFIALTQVTAVFYMALVFWAVSLRRNTQWHRRLMFASLILILEPALGRVLPLPLMMPWGEWAVLVVQLAVFLVILRHDRKTLGRMHPATWAGIAAVTLQHVVIEGLAIAPPFIRFAEAIAAR